MSAEQRHSQFAQLVTITTASCRYRHAHERGTDDLVQGANTPAAQDFHIPLQVVDGMFVLPFEVLSATDPRRRDLPSVSIAPTKEHRPATSFFPSDHPAAGTVMWRATYHQAALVAHANKTLVCSTERGCREKLIAATESALNRFDHQTDGPSQVCTDGSLVHG